MICPQKCGHIGTQGRESVPIFFFYAHHVADRVECHTVPVQGSEIGLQKKPRNFKINIVAVRHTSDWKNENIFRILIRKYIFLYFFLAFVVMFLWSELLTYNHKKSFAGQFLGSVLFNPRYCGLEKTALRVFHFSIITEKWNTPTALKRSPKLDFWLKSGNKRHKKALYDKLSEVKVVYKTPRKDYIFFSNFLSLKNFEY